MGLLEQVTQMRNQGKSDDEIISDLRKQKVSPKEINEALNQAQIKNAVSDIRGPQDTQEQPSQINQNQNFGQYNPQEKEFNQEMYTPQEAQEYTPQQGYQSYGQEGYNTDQNYAPPQQEDQGYQEYENQPQEAQNDIIVEISEQVFNEKSKEMSKKIDSFEEFKSLTQTKINHLTERLKRIEFSIDKLQAAILEKVGSYGRDLNSIKKEMSMMQDTFTKTLNPLISLATKKPSHETKPKKEKPSKKK